jgi:cation diffusion facilitator CzcD-associated flavoprotein CzcO
VQQTNTLIIGASFSELASAACLRKQNIEFIIIEKRKEVAVPWCNHYSRLHLHTNKRLSSLPYKKFKKEIPDIQAGSRSWIMLMIIKSLLMYLRFLIPKQYQSRNQVNIG